MLTGDCSHTCTDMLHTCNGMCDIINRSWKPVASTLYAAVNESAEVPGLLLPRGAPQAISVAYLHCPHEPTV